MYHYVSRYVRDALNQEKVVETSLERGVPSEHVGGNASNDANMEHE